MAMAVALVLVACGDGDDAADDPQDDAAAEPAEEFTVGMAIGGTDFDWMVAQGEVAEALAERRGWNYVQVDNDLDATTANQNADILIEEGVDAVITFNGEPSVNPVIAQKFEEAGIPVITYDIAQEGWYFVGIDNESAGIWGGEQLGEIAKERWDCEVDLVMSGEGADAGIVNEFRTGGGREGIRNVCPDIPEDRWISFETDGQVSVATPAARDVLTANPGAERILTVGLNDSAVVGALEANDQLGGDREILAWGQDGSLITGDNVHPNLMGSVFYFLEGYAVYAFEILDDIAAGNPPEVRDQPEDATIYIDPCPVTAEEAAEIPGIEERTAAIIDAEDGTTATDLFCAR